MGVYENLMTQIDDAGLLFNVNESRVFAEKRNVIAGRVISQGVSPVPGKKALINAKTDQVISIVSDRYKVVTNEEIFSAFCDSVQRSPINAEDAQVVVKQTETGGRAMVDFVFPNHYTAVTGDTSRTALQLCALNSFDGSLRYMVKAGGLRMKCLNGQVLGNIVGSYSSTHTSSLKVQDSADHVVRMITDFNKAREYWSGLMQRSVSNNEAYEVIRQFLNLPEDFDMDQPNARFEHCCTLAGRYFEEMGHNLYALYNALTDYVSHPIKKSKNPTAKTTRERAKIQQVINAWG